MDVGCTLHKQHKSSVRGGGGGSTGKLLTTFVIKFFVLSKTNSEFLNISDHYFLQKVLGGLYVPPLTLSLPHLVQQKGYITHIVILHIISNSKGSNKE